MPALDVSVVVLTHNSFTSKAGCIRHSMAALSHQQEVKFEVIVVDNGSTPQDHAHLLQACADRSLQHLSMKLVRLNTSIGAARNAGAQRAQCSVVVFLDDDAILLDITALAQVQRAAATASFGYAAKRLWTYQHPWFEEHHEAALVALQAGDLATFSRYCGAPQIADEGQRIFYERTYIGHFGFVQRHLFLRVGGFPDIFQGYGCEDDALSLVLYLNDRRFAWLGNICVAHIDHARPARYAGEHASNRLRYNVFLDEHGIDAFNTDVLLAGGECEASAPVVIPSQGCNSRRPHPKGWS